MDKEMAKYVVKRIILALITSFIIMFINFVFIKMLEPELPMMGAQAETEKARRAALGYNKPILVQFGIYVRNIVTKWDWGTSWKIAYLEPVDSLLFSRFAPTILLNIYSTILSVPIGIGLGIIAALHKNKFIDHFISTAVMIFISVPPFVYAFLLQYTVGFRLGWLPMVVYSIHDAGGWTTKAMFISMIMPTLALSFGSIAYYARFTRAELVESLTSDYMLLARTKGLSKGQATVRHALKNAMVPILPTIIATFLSVLTGSIVIEKIFAVAGVGSLSIDAIRFRDYDVFVMTSMFYSVFGLTLSILVDLSYGFLDPRIRMGVR